MLGSSFHVVLDLTRVEEAGDPYAFRFMPQEYLGRGAGGGVETARLVWDDDLLADLKALRAPRPDPAVVQRVGGRLRTFLKSAGWVEHERAIGEAVASGLPVIVTIRSNAAELYALPWELMTIEPSGRHLGKLPGVLIRYAWPKVRATAEGFPRRHEGGRIVVAWSAAGGAVPAAEHQNAVAKAASRSPVAFDRAGDVLAHASFGRLDDVLTAAAKDEDRRIGVLHLLCHGGRVGQTIGLSLNGEKASGEGAMVDAGQLRDLLAPHAGRLRLVVVSACDGANTGAAGNELGSVAQAIHRAGIEAVIASRFPLSVEGSTVFAETLYHELLGRPAAVEAAFLAARERLARDPERLDWAGLQLYSGTVGDAGTEGGDSRPVVFRPFRGLLAFRPEHSRFLFGRDAEIAEVVGDLEALITAGKPRFLVVSGASGTGKSSMVLGGAVPRLLAQKDARWEFVEVRPGPEPMVALKAAQARRGDPGRPLLLVIDQFEEVFTQTSSVTVREQFVRALWGLAGSQESMVSVILTLRVDFIGRCGEIALDASGRRLDRVAYDEAYRVFVPQMASEQIEAAITRPAQLVGLTLEEGLCDRMIKDVGAEPGALPLLEDTLDLLWQRRKGRSLTHAVYHAVGGAVGALHGRADAWIDGLAEADAAVARQLLVQLVNTGDDVVVHTRRRVPQRELRPHGAAAAARFEQVVGRLVNERLLVRDEKERIPTLEIAHEALIRRWKRLQEWLKAEHEAKERARRRRLIIVTISALSVTVILAGGIAWALGQRDAATVAERDARAQAERARDASLVAGSRELLARGQPGPARTVLLEVKDPEGARGWSQVARDVLAGGLPQVTLRGHQKGLHSAEWSPDGRRIFTTSQFDTPWVWNADGTGQPLVLDVGSRVAIHSAAWSPDGQRIVTVSSGGMRVWNTDGTDRFLTGSERSAVEFAVWSPDGKHIVTVGYETLVWNADGTGQTVALNGHEESVESAAWSPDGRRIVTASSDDTARVWNADGTGEPVVLKGHEDNVTSAVWSPDGQSIVTASMDDTAQVWNADGTGEPVVLKGHEDNVTSAAWSRDGQHILTASDDRTARVWNANGTGQPVVLRGHEQILVSAAWSPDGQRILTASWDKTARVWNADGMGEPLILRGHEEHVNSAVWSPDGQRIVTASEDKTARVWNTADRMGEPFVLMGHERPVRSAAWSPDQQHIVTASEDKTARVWNTADSRGEPVVLRGHEAAVGSAAWSPDGQRILTTSVDRTARVWNADDTGEPVVLRGQSAAWSPDGQRVTASADDTARVWKADGTGEPIVLGGHEGYVESAAWSPDGQRIVTASHDRTARVWNADGTGQPIVLRGHEDNVDSVAWSPDGQHILTASWDKTARVWNADGTGEPVVLKGHEDNINSAAWSPDGQHILTASDDRTARVWQADGAGQPIILKGHEGSVWSAAWSPDGQRIVSASADKTARVWKADGTGEPVILRGHEGNVFTAIWSPDGQHVITTSGDRTARIWIATVPALRQVLSGAAADCLTPEMRRTYLYEFDGESHAGYEACERSYGRVPFYPATSGS